jgi:hypothetical protein
MSNGAGLQLAALGSENAIVMGKPGVIHFKYSAKKYSNFSSTIMEHVVEGTVDFGNRIEFNIPKGGDLLGNIFLSVTLPTVYLDKSNGKENILPIPWVYAVGYRMIEQVELQIGGRTIERFNGDWLINQSILNKDGVLPSVTLDNSFSASQDYSLIGREKEILVPLNFFTKDNHNALPLIGLHGQTSIKVVIDLASREKLLCDVGPIVVKDVWNSIQTNSPIGYTTVGSSISTSPTQWIKGYNTFFYLDEIDKQTFMGASSLDYLISTPEMNLYNSISMSAADNSNPNRYNHVPVFTGSPNQTIDSNGAIIDFPLSFTGLSRYMLWTITADMEEQEGTDELNAPKINNVIPYVPWNVAPKGSALRFNNVDRLPLMPFSYFNRYTKYETMGEMPPIYQKYYSPQLIELESFQETQRRLQNQSYYSFELNHNSRDPSGCCNFNRLDNASLRIDTGRLDFKQNSNHLCGANFNQIRPNGNYIVNIYSCRYNVVRVANGQIGLAFE